MREKFTPNTGMLNADNDKHLYALIIIDTLKSSNVSLGGTATIIPTTALSGRHLVYIFNNSNDIIYIGASDVTTSNGYPIYPHGQFVFQIDENIDIYGISAGTNSDIRILEGA